MRIPSCTYRIQLHKDFTFRDLAALIGYLHELGISTIYASPITKAFKGSRHGYDVTDPLIINPEIGTAQELAELAAQLKKYQMTWLQDIVPNHMAYDSDNPWLYDVLERGKDSAWYSFFDIEAEQPLPSIGHKIMAPFLGNTPEECLQKGEITLRYTEKGFVIRCYDKDYPVATYLYPWIGRTSMQNVVNTCPPEFAASLEQFAQTSLISAGQWNDYKKEWLRQVAANPACRSFMASRATSFNEQPELIAELLQGQHYALTAASLANTHINYRRFFTINSLICLRMEKEAVLTAYHKLIHQLYQQDLIQGLRIDHIDGLAAPKPYLSRLKNLFGEDCYIVAEKILAWGESLPEDWALEGTTGYEFLSTASQVLTDPDGSRQLLDFYRQQVPGIPSYEDLVFEKKITYLCNYMGGELDNLVALLTRLSLLHADMLDMHQLKEALATLMASFPIYRLYPGEAPFQESARQIIRTAFSRSKDRRPECRPELAFLERIFDSPAPASPTSPATPETTSTDLPKADPSADQRLQFLSRLMQFTGPLAAKGIEDTSFYVYHPYIAHNEVGDTPSVAGITSEVFHNNMTDRLATLPHSLNATTTHDTKRGEDSRIRLNWLSAIPEEWIAAVTRWKTLNQPFIVPVNHRPSPSPNDEYLVYQSLLGGFPDDLVVTDAFRQRFHDYLTKALREAKTETNYDHPDEAYEEKCHAFATALLLDDAPFLKDFIPFAAKVIGGSAPYSLSQLLIKLTAPGVPDIYQGAELWETSFVDPDNRRPVDYSLRQSLLKKIKEEEKKNASSALNFIEANQQKGAAKLWVILRTMAYRNQYPQVFTKGAYLPVSISGNILAYIRKQDSDWALIVVPLIRKPPPAAASPATEPGANPTRSIVTASSPGIHLPTGAPLHWTNRFTGETVRLNTDAADLLKRFPVALFTASTEKTAAIPLPR